MQFLICVVVPHGLDIGGEGLHIGKLGLKSTLWQVVGNAVNPTKHDPGP